MRRLLLAIAILALAGCATTPPAPAPVAPDDPQIIRTHPKVNYPTPYE